MWTEIYIDKFPLPLGATTNVVPEGEGKSEGKWIPIDATLAKGGIGAGHLKISPQQPKRRIGL